MIAVLLSLVLVTAPQEPQVSKPDVLLVGHVVEVRGSLDEQGRFVAEKAELKPVTTDDVLIGTVPESEKDPTIFALLGQPVETDADTHWDNIERGSLAGKRVKLEGRWKGPNKFAVKDVNARGSGRDRIGARIDELRKVEGGWEARMMIFTVLLKDDTPVEHELPLAEYGLAKQQVVAAAPSESSRYRSEEDEFGSGIRLADGLFLTGQLEGKRSREAEFDLDESDPRDRTDLELTARARVAWRVSDSFSTMTEVRFSQLFREQQGKGFESNQNILLGETYLRWHDAIGVNGFEVLVGRQDFDDEREWIYDQNLDGVRVAWERPAWSLELAAAETISDGSTRDEAADNLSLYLDNNNRKRHLAAWVFYRDIGTHEASSTQDLAERNLHVGLRAIGKFLPQNKSWADFSVLSATRDETTGGNTVSRDVLGWGYDIGTTWSPPFADPLYFTLGYALGTGDDSTSGDDGTFRQTGLQDNTGKLGGVTSFQYYGELIDPELSNLGILTVGVGGLLATKTSLDLVYHTYTQDVAKTTLSTEPVESSLRRATLNGTDSDIGSEVDVIFGYRRFASWDVELVGAWFMAGDAFTVGDDAFMTKIQLRYRF